MGLGGKSGERNRSPTGGKAGDLATVAVGDGEDAVIQAAPLRIKVDGHNFDPRIGRVNLLHETAGDFNHNQRRPVRHPAAPRPRAQAGFPKGHGWETPAEK